MHRLSRPASRWLAAYSPLLAGAAVLVVDTSPAAVNPQPPTRAIALKRSGSAVPPAPKTMAECETAKAALMASDGKTKTSGQWVYECVESSRTVGTFVPNWPPAVCTSPKPAIGSRTVQCPVPTVGTWSQTQDYVPGAYPTCGWTPGLWLPAEPAAGICAAPSETWTACANEYGRCSFTGTRRVRYGTGSTWVIREFTDGVACGNAAFGADPAPGASKRCELGAGAQAPAATGSARLQWRPPTENTDGSALTDLAGYRVLAGTAPDELAPSAELSSPAATSAVISSLKAGTWFFVVRSLNAAGAESANSAVAVKLVQ